MTISIEDQFCDILGQLSEDLSRDISLDELMKVLSNISLQHYTEILDALRTELDEVNISQEVIQRAKSFIIYDLDIEDLSTTVDNTIYG